MPESSDGPAPASNSSGGNNNNNDNSNEPNNTSPGSAGRGGRRRNNRRNRRNARPKAEAFEGACADLKGAVYELTENKTYFAETTRKIATYLGRHLKDAMDYRLVLLRRELIDIPEPRDPGPAATPAELADYTEDRKIYRKRLDTRRAMGGIVYSLLTGQCSPALLGNMQTDREWDDIDLASDPVRLLDLIEKYMSKGKTNKYPGLTSVQGKAAIMRLKQDRFMSTYDYHQRFLDVVGRSESNDASFGANMGRVKALMDDGGKDFDTATGVEIEVYRDRVVQEQLAVAFIMNADPRQYGRLRQDLANRYTHNNDSSYPSTVADAYRLMMNWEEESANTTAANAYGTRTSEYAFATDGYDQRDGYNRGSGRGRG